MSDGADAYPDDPNRWLKDSSSSDGASSSSTAVFAVAGIAIVAVIAGLVFFFVRKSDDGNDVNKDWNSGNFAQIGGTMPAMPNMAGSTHRDGS